MTKLSPRFSEPIDMARPRGARLLEAFSPKLGRLIRHFDRAAFDYWVVLEADPGVEIFCGVLLISVQKVTVRTSSNRAGRRVAGDASACL